MITITITTKPSTTSSSLEQTTASLLYVQPKKKYSVAIKKSVSHVVKIE